MGTGNKQGNEPAKKRLSLGNSEAVRASLCKLIRQRYNNSIDTALFRDLVYAINVLLGYDKHIIETDMNKRIEQLESYIRGEGGTVIDPKELDSPYAADLRRRLAESDRVNSGLKNEILGMKRQLSAIQAEASPGHR